MYMAERPGMQHKHLPLAFDPATGNLFSGGRYLFDKAHQAEAYKAWVQNDFILDGTKFLERPIFIGPECHAWTVIGAHDFEADRLAARAPHRALERAVDNAKKELRDLWAGIRAEADQRDLSAAWLLYSKHEHLAQASSTSTDRVGPADPTMPDFASLGALAGSPALGHSLADLGGSKTFDRSQWILTVWSPFEAGDQGEPSLWPYSPPFPAPFCGDGPCEPSRSETRAAPTRAAAARRGRGDAGVPPGTLKTPRCPADAASDRPVESLRFAGDTLASSCTIQVIPHARSRPAQERSPGRRLLGAKVACPSREGPRCSAHRGPYVPPRLDQPACRRNAPDHSTPTRARWTLQPLRGSRPQKLRTGAPAPRAIA